MPARADRRPFALPFAPPFALLCLLPFALPVAAAADDDGAGAADQIVETFDDRGFDRRLWSLDPDKPPGVRLDLDRDRLHVVVPAGTEGRPSAVFAGRFGLEGNFEITADYDLTSFPTPAGGTSLKCEVFVEGPGGAASVMRESARDAPAGVVLWFGPPKGSDADGAWARAETADRAGSLRLKRAGETLEFLVAAPAPVVSSGTRLGEQTFRSLGEVVYGTEPVTAVQLRVSAPQIASPADLTLDNVRVAAEAIRRPFQPAEPSAGLWPWAGVAAAVVVVLAVAGWFVSRRRRSA